MTQPGLGAGQSENWDAVLEQHLEKPEGPPPPKKGGGSVNLLHIGATLLNYDQALFIFTS